MIDKGLTELKGIHSFRNHLLVQKEALGLEVKTEIMGVPVKLCFPKPSAVILTMSITIPSAISQITHKILFH